MGHAFIRVEASDVNRRDGGRRTGTPEIDGAVQGCLEPGAVTYDDLMAYVDGDAPVRVIDHVRRCAACLADARARAREQQQLRTVLNRFDCPSAHTLGEYALSVLAPHEQRLVAAHAVDCPRCSDELQQLRSFLSVEPEPAPTVVERLRRVIATLVMAPRGAPAFAELRGSQNAAVAETLTYRAGDVTISFDVDADGLRDGTARWAVNGLITQSSGVAPPRGEIRLISLAGDVYASHADVLGNFLYESVHPGTYRLEVDLPDRMVVIEELRIGDG